MLLRYISIQMLERPGGTEEDRLEVVEVEVEGWSRSCGEITRYLQSPLTVLSLSRESLSTHHCHDWGAD